MQDYDEFDEATEAEFVALKNNVEKLRKYFFDVNKDMSQLIEMISVYDKVFDKMNEKFLKNKYQSNHHQEISEMLKTFKLISEKVVETLCLQRDGVEIGHFIVQALLDKKQKVLGDCPALIQYVFLKLCQHHNIPFQALSYYDDYQNAAVTDFYNDSIVISYSIRGNKFKDICVKNAYTFYVLAHELQHIRQKHSNPEGTSEEKLLHLYSQSQKLEDGWDKNPTHHIAKHVQFPDEVRADYDACKEVYQFLTKEFSISEEDLLLIKQFLKQQRVKLVKMNVDSQEPLSPEEYLDHFVDTKLKNNTCLTETEKERVEKFLQIYEEVRQKNLEL